MGGRSKNKKKSNAANDFREKKSLPYFEKFGLMLLDPKNDIIYLSFTSIDSVTIRSVMVEIQIKRDEYFSQTFAFANEKPKQRR